MEKRGGFRKNAGRPRRNNSNVNHKRRLRVGREVPFLITMKLLPNQVSLRTPGAFAKFREGVIGTKAFGFRVIEFAILSNHIHLVAESDSNAELESAMKSLTLKLTRTLGIRFKERFHMRLIRTPRQLRLARIYTVANAAKHAKRRRVFDWYSSYPAYTNAQWKFCRPDLDWEIPDHEYRDKYLEVLSAPRSELAAQL